MGGAYLSSWLINLRHCHSCTNFAKKTIEFLHHVSMWLGNGFIFYTKCLTPKKEDQFVALYIYHINGKLMIVYSIFDIAGSFDYANLSSSFFLFSYFIFVIQAAYLWVCLVGMGDDHHEAIRYRLTTSDAWNFLQWYLNLGIRLEACYKAVHIALMTYLNVSITSYHSATYQSISWMMEKDHARIIEWKGQKENVHGKKPILPNRWLTQGYNSWNSSAFCWKSA